MVLNLLKRKTFPHGIHPPEMKEWTKDKPIRQFPFAPVMVIPLQQHIGGAAKPVVKEGQEVVRGQLIAEPSGFLSVAMHAPASGVVKKIGLTPSPMGKMVPGIYIQSYPGSTGEIAATHPCDLDTNGPDEILHAIQEAGIVGLGGAAFPTHAKLSVPKDKQIDLLIINGVECEPFLTTDHRVMLEQADDIFSGLRYVLKATGAPRAVIGVEANKTDAAEHLRKNIPSDIPATVEVMEVKYPQGAEKMLIKSVMGREVPSGGLPSDAGAVVINVATTAEIGRLLPVGRGIMERVVTITGPAVQEKGNYLIPIGTTVRYALEQVGVNTKATKVLLGGPMMGPALSDLDVPITKGTSGLLVLEETSPTHIYNCIRCGWCVDACPVSLNPSRLGILANNREYETMADDWNLMDCFECGSCSYICPSNIPLVQQFRVAKGIIRETRSKK